MFLTSSNVYFVFGYAFVRVYVLNCYLAFSGFFGTRFGFSCQRQVGKSANHMTCCSSVLCLQTSELRFKLQLYYI